MKDPMPYLFAFMLGGIIMLLMLALGNFDKGPRAQVFSCIDQYGLKACQIKYDAYTLK